MKLDNLEKAFFWLFTEATRHELMEYAPEDIDFEAAEQELNAAKKAADAQWISVKDRLPENYCNVLAFNGKESAIAWYLKQYDNWFSNDHDFTRRKVTNWMPLPEPPKGCVEEK